MLVLKEGRKIFTLIYSKICTVWLKEAEVDPWKNNKLNVGNIPLAQDANEFFIHRTFLKKMGQTRPLFVYFRPFQMTNIAQIP